MNQSADFSISLVRTGAAGPFERSDEQLVCELEDIDAALQLITEIAALRGDYLFRVSGFGQPEWPVDLRVDLLVIVEQLPNALTYIDKDHAEFSLDFYEQGIERYLHFNISRNGFVNIACTSETDWKPHPPEIVLPTEQVREMFQKLAKSFYLMAKDMCPEVAGSTLLIPFWHELKIAIQ